MPTTTYYWTFLERFNTGLYADVSIKITTDNPDKARTILMDHIINASRFGYPRIFISPKGDTIISHSNDLNTRNLPFIDIDFLIFDKILHLYPKIVLELNHQAKPFIPKS